MFYFHKIFNFGVYSEYFDFVNIDFWPLVYAILFIYLLDSRAISSANSKSSSLLVNLHLIPVFLLSMLCLITQFNTSTYRNSSSLSPQ